MHVCSILNITSCKTNCRVSAGYFFTGKGGPAAKSARHIAWRACFFFREHNGPPTVAAHVRVARALLEEFNKDWIKEKRQSWESGAVLNRWNCKAIDCMLNQLRVIFHTSAQCHVWWLT